MKYQDKGRLFLSSTKSTFAKDNKADTTSTQVQYVHGKIEKLRKRSHNLLKMEEKYIKMLRESNTNANVILIVWLSFEIRFLSVIAYMFSHKNTVH